MKLKCLAYIAMPAVVIDVCLQGLSVYIRVLLHMFIASDIISSKCFYMKSRHTGNSRANIHSYTASDDDMQMYI